MKYRETEYNVFEDVPGRWRYVVYPLSGKPVYSDPVHRTREAAVQAAIYESDNGIERSRQKPST